MNHIRQDDSLETAHIVSFCGHFKGIIQQAWLALSNIATIDGVIEF